MQHSEQGKTVPKSAKSEPRGKGAESGRAQRTVGGGGSKATVHNAVPVSMCCFPFANVQIMKAGRGRINKAGKIKSSFHSTFHELFKVLPVHISVWIGLQYLECGIESTVNGTHSEIEKARDARVEHHARQSESMLLNAPLPGMQNH